MKELILLIIGVIITGLLIPLIRQYGKKASIKYKSNKEKILRTLKILLLNTLAIVLIAGIVYFSYIHNKVDKEYILIIAFNTLQLSVVIAVIIANNLDNFIYQYVNVLKNKDSHNKEHYK